MVATNSSPEDCVCSVDGHFQFESTMMIRVRGVPTIALRPLSLNLVVKVYNSIRKVVCLEHVYSPWNRFFQFAKNITWPSAESSFVVTMYNTTVNSFNDKMI